MLRSSWPSSRSQTATKVQIQFRWFKGDRCCSLALSKRVKRNGFHYDCPLTSASWVVKPSWTLKQLTSTHKRLYTLSSSPSFLLLLLIVLSHLFPLYLPMLYNIFPINSLSVSCPPHHSAVVLHLSHVLFHQSSHTILLFIIKAILILR